VKRRALSRELAEWRREVLAGHTEEIVGKWRAVIAAHPHLARYSLRPDGQKDPLGAPHQW